MAISLEKRAEAAQAALINMRKAQKSKGIDLGELVAQVIIAIDFSGSMHGRYGNGEVQQAVERALALSISGLDDDGIVQVFFFDDQSYPMESVSIQNYQGFVSKWAARRSMGSTNYAPTIRDIIKFVSGKKSIFGRRKNIADEAPVFVIFVTDGEPYDQKETIKELIDAARLPIFWQFLGLGYTPEFLEMLDTMDGRVIDNVGLTSFQDTLKMDDTDFFNSLIVEFFTMWLPEARQKGITRK